MRGEPEVVLALANLATMANLGGRLTMPLRSPDVRASDLEEERKRISRELHDGVAQELQAIVMHLRLALADDTDESACLATVTALAIAERGLAMTRSLLADLHGHGRPGCAPSESLARALSDSLCEATRYSILDVDLDLEEGVRISHQVYAELTRMVREIATNTIKHAKATTISCAIQPCANSASCQVKIRDDGIGFDVAATRAGCGMRGLRERAARIGATVSIESLSGQGTLVRLFVPTV